MATAPSAERAFRYASEVESLANRFEALTLTRAEWTHRAHLTVALWYRSRLEHDEALATVRRGILRLNETLGIVSTPTSGYHETITRFYMRMVSAFVESDLADGDWAARANRLLDELGAKDLPLRYYTEARLMSLEARADWIEPDLQPLP